MEMFSSFAGFLSAISSVPLKRCGRRSSGFTASMRIIVRWPAPYGQPSRFGPHSSWWLRKIVRYLIRRLGLNTGYRL